MPITRETEFQKRRKRSNYLLGAVLGGFVLLVFAITIVKMVNGEPMQAFDHVLRPEMENVK